MSNAETAEPPLREGDHRTLARVRSLLGEGSTIDYAPALRAAAARRARQIHHAWLPPSLPILALHDQTLLGTGEEGFVVTAERLGFRGFLEQPWSVRWEEVDLGSVRVDAHRLSIGPLGGHLEDRHILGRLHDLVRRFAELPRGPYR